MKKRPESVTVIAWMMILFSSFLLVFFFTAGLKKLTLKELIDYSHIRLYFESVINVISGLGMLQGLNWSRYLYVVWGLVGYGIAFTTSPTKHDFYEITPIQIMSIIFFVMFSYFLFCPKANAYFGKSEVKA